MKILASFVNNLSAMIVSSSAADLYEELMDLPDGVVKIDLLSCSGYLNESRALKSSYIKELSSWLLGKVYESNIELNELSKAVITLNIDSSTVPCDRKHTIHYLATATTVIDTRVKHFEQSTPVTHVWHKRLT